jgi:predicted Zn-dependent protease
MAAVPGGADLDGAERWRSAPIPPHHNAAEVAEFADGATGGSDLQHPPAPASPPAPAQSPAPTSQSRGERGQDETATAAAIRRYEERLARDPTSLAFATLADLYRKAGRVSEAAALCRQGLERVPHYTTARLILAKALMAAGDLEGARAELQVIADTTPKDAQCQRLLAEVHRARGDVDATVRHLQTALRLDPGDRESRAALALLTAAPAGGADTGIARVLRDDTFATATFGTICLEQGLVEEASTVFTRLLRRDPGSRTAREGLESALRARTPRKRG